jgi:hypothetical protein
MKAYGINGVGHGDYLRVPRGGLRQSSPDMIDQEASARDDQVGRRFERPPEAGGSLFQLHMDHRLQA